MSQENEVRKGRLVRYVNREQLGWRAVDMDQLIGEDHPARAIWTLVGGLDLSRYYRAIGSSPEQGGRPAFDPQLLISMWVYAYSQSIGSAREVARRCEYDPAFQWLSGMDEVNYHTLADFRVEQQQELDELFTQVLAALSQEGLVTLEQVMQDGTKIRALASGKSLQREGSIRNHLEGARRRVADDPGPGERPARPGRLLPRRHGRPAPAHAAGADRDQPRDHAQRGLPGPSRLRGLPAREGPRTRTLTTPGGVIKPAPSAIRRCPRR